MVEKQRKERAKKMSARPIRVGMSARPLKHSVVEILM
jgi:hypothetical protein